MGWGSAGAIFDPIAYAVINTDASPETKQAILKATIETLRYNDWDTWEESLSAFANVPDVVAAFGALGLNLLDDDEDEDTTEVAR